MPQPKRYKSGFGSFPKPKKPKSERRLLCESALAGNAAAIARLKSWGIVKWTHKGRQIIP